MDRNVFITYSWDNQAHKDWVRKLADNLIENGIDVYLDQYDLNPGDSVTNFMEKSIEKSHKVIVILTPNYKEKSLNRKGGVGYEQQIISGEIMSGIERNKFIPILRNGSFESRDDCAIPPHFKGIITLDFRNDEDFKPKLEELLRTIYSEPKLVRPTKGRKPDFSKNSSPNKTFNIKLTKDYKCILSDIKLAEIFSDIAELRREKKNYDLSFEIEGITDIYADYLDLNARNNLTDIEIKRKLMIREYLDNHFYLEKGTLYDYLTFSINLIIDYSFLEFRNFTKSYELAICLKNCIYLYNPQNVRVNPGLTGFDVFQERMRWSFKIYISQDELSKLHSKFGTDNNMFLTAIAGLDVYDLSYETIIDIVIPRQSYRFTQDFFCGVIQESQKYEFMELGNWRIGLA